MLNARPIVKACGAAHGVDAAEKAAHPFPFIAVARAPASVRRGAGNTA